MEDEESLRLLLKQRVNRPNYARVISWEFSQAEEKLCPPRHLKKDKDNTKQQQKDDDEELEEQSSEYSNSDDEFFSAGEEFECEEEEGEQEETSEEDSVLVSGSERPSKPSRRKAKWKRKLLRHEFLGPYQHIENMDTSIFGSEVLPVEECVAKHLSLEKPVPTLVEICLRANCSKTSLLNAKDQCIPPLLQENLALYKNGRADVSALLSWLHRTLAFMEKLVTVANDVSSYQYLWFRYLPTKTDKRGEKIYSQVHMRSCRQLWRSTLEIHYDHIVKHELNIVPISHNPGMHPCPGANVTTALSFLAHTIDIMLPPFWTDRKDLERVTEEDKSRLKAQNTMVLRVKRALATRYPQLTELMFDEAVAYVWWARGDIVAASNAFTKIISEHTHTHHKALYTTELARMYLYFREMNKAIRHFSLVTDFLEADGKYSSNLGLIKIQTSTLSACVMDCGIVNATKLTSVRNIWEDIIESIRQEHFEFDAECKTRACTSMVFCHWGAKQKSSDEWHEAIIEQYNLTIPSLPELYLYRAMICSMMGNKSESYRAYRDFMNRYVLSGQVSYGSDTPGQRFRNSDIDYNPFKLLAVQAKETRTRIEPVRMMWRVQLVHPILEAKHGFVIADESYEGSNLWLTEEGYISGDMYMQLPPMRKIQLDPYTGAIRFSVVPSTSNIWTHQPSEMTDKDGLILPRVLRVHQNKKIGISVDIYISNVKDNRGSKDYGRVGRTSCYCGFIQWNGPDGQKVKVNVKKLARSEVKRMIAAEIVNKYDPLKDGFELGSKMWVDRMNAVLTKYYNCGWQFNYRLISKSVEDEIKKADKDKIAAQEPVNNQKGKKRVKNKRYRHYKNRPSTTTPVKELKEFFNLQLSKYAVCGDTVLLLLRTSYDQIVMCFDCTTRESFKEPKVNSTLTALDSWLVMDTFTGTGCQKNSLAKVYTLEQVTSHGYAKTNEVRVFRSKGNELIREHNETNNYGKKKSFSATTHVIDEWMYGISPKDDCFLVCDKLFTSEKSQAFSHIDFMDRIHRHLVIRTIEGVIILGKDMRPVKVTGDNRKLSIYSEGYVITGDWVNVLYTKEDESQGQAEPRVTAVLGIDNYILVLKLYSDGRSNADVECVMDIQLPGSATEVFFIPEIQKWIVTATLMNIKDQFYFEDLYVIDMEGKVCKILPRLGPGPHGFIATSLGPNPDLASTFPDVDMSSDGWYLYFKDGHMGICCARLY